MIHSTYSSLKGFALLLYVVVTLITLFLLIGSGSTLATIIGALNAIGNGIVVWQTYKKLNTNK